MGALMLLEEAIIDDIARRLGADSRVIRLVRRVPSPLIAIGLQLLVLPAFAPLFMRSWLEAGMLDEMRGLVPHVAC